MRPVFWSLDAQRDNLQILTYLAAENPFAAERVITAIEETGNALGILATGKPGRVTGTYEKPLTRYPYVLAYALQPISGVESVVIVRIIHMARDWTADEWPQQ